jgi:hypothetical protein
MRRRYKIASTVLFITTLCSYSIAQSKAEEQLKKERSNLTRTTNPLSRTKIEIKISDLLITLMTDAARAGDDKKAEQYLNDYSNTIADAHLTMMKTGKDAHKHPEGFKDLEISLRKQQSRLADAGKLMDIDSRDAVDKVRKQASDISDQLVKTMLLRDSNAVK